MGRAAGSPWVAAGSLGGRREFAICGADAGSLGVAAWVGQRSAPTSGSQNWTSGAPAVRAERRVVTKVRHWAWQAEVMSSPFQEEGTRVPSAFHPGHAPCTTQ